MTRQRGITFLAFALTFAFAVVSLGFSQTSDSGTTSTSTSTNTINATVYAGGGGRQLIEAMPGSGTTIIPGVTSGNSPWRPYWPVLNRCIPVAQLMAAPNGHSKIRVYRETRQPLTRDKQIDEVCLVDWQPNDIAHGDDREVGEATGTGKDGYPDDSAFMPTLKKLVMETNTRRVAVQRRYLGQFHTKTLSGGLGGAGSVTADNNVGGSGAFGVSLGSSKTKNEDPVEFDLIALNDGPVDRPVVQGPVKAQAPAAPQAPQPESKALPVQTIRIEVVTVPSAPNTAAPAQPLQPLTPSATTMPTTACVLPNLTVYFDFDKADVKSEYHDGIQTMAAWLEHLPACKVQVQGHASKEASFGYNAKLGRQRAEAVYNLLLAAGVPKYKLEFASLGKDFPKGDYEKENRRVILVVQGDASGR